MKNKESKKNKNKKKSKSRPSEHLCVRCGYCCMKGPCAFAEWDEASEKYKCKFLEVDDPEKRTFLCSKYKDIKELERNSPFPMFDCGCSSPLFNDIRANVRMEIDNDPP